MKRNSYIFIQENAFENVVCEMAANLSRPQCVKILRDNVAKHTSTSGFRLMHIVVVK